MAEDAGNGHDVNGFTGTAATAALAERTLTGDLRDFFLRLLREQRNPWALLSEMQQTNLAAGIEHACETLVRRAVEIIAAHDMTAVGVSLEQIAFKPKGIEAKMLFGPMAAQTRHELVDAQGGRIVIVIADPDRYRGSRGLATVDRDQPELPIEMGAAPAPFETEPGEGGEGAATDADLAPPADLASLDPEPADQLGYRFGYSQGLDGIALADLDCPYPEDSPERARCEAAWWTARIERTVDPAEQEKLTECAAEYFSDLGRIASEAGAQPTDCPFLEWMPARQWWNEGYFAEDVAAPKKPRRRGKGANGEAAAP